MSLSKKFSNINLQITQSSSHIAAEVNILGKPLAIILLLLPFFLLFSCNKNIEEENPQSLQTGLAGYWNFNELSGNASDLIGAHNGITFNVVHQGIGKIGTGYNFFNESKSYVYCGAIPLTTNSFSLWAKRSVIEGSECYVGFGDTFPGLWILSTGQIALVNNSGAAIATWGMWTDILAYHHIVLVTSFDGASGKVELYVDGISQGEQSCTPLNISNFVIGSVYADGAFNSSYSFSGVIDEVGLWDRALPSDEVIQLYNQGLGQTYPFKGVTPPDVYFYLMTNKSSLLHSVGDKRIISEAVGESKYIKYSSDNGVSYNAGINITSSGFVIDEVRILANGNIVLFSGKTEIYYSDDNLATIHLCKVLGKDGSAYSYHVPVNADYPGAYFNFMGGFIENEGISVLGNYTNSEMGASPVNLYYSLDGITWKVFYTFGQNPNMTDDGTSDGGVGGTLLGDPNNTLTTRHIHAVNIGGDGNFYVGTGDSNEEMHFMKCSYNKITDTWVVNDLLKGNSVTLQRMRSLGVYERNGFLYWGSDGPGTFTFEGTVYDCFGIYKCAVSDINDPAKHILLQPLTDACYSFVNVDHIVLAGLQSYGYVYISFDYGETWSSYMKPSWMTGSVDGIWYNELYKFFMVHNKYAISSMLF